MGEIADNQNEMIKRIRDLLKRDPVESEGESRPDSAVSYQTPAGEVSMKELRWFALQAAALNLVLFLVFGLAFTIPCAFWDSYNDAFDEYGVWVASIAGVLAIILSLGVHIRYKMVEGIWWISLPLLVLYHILFTLISLGIGGAWFNSNSVMFPPLFMTATTIGHLIVPFFKDYDVMTASFVLTGGAINCLTAILCVALDEDNWEYTAICYLLSLGAYLTGVVEGMFYGPMMVYNPKVVFSKNFLQLSLNQASGVLILPLQMIEVAVLYILRVFGIHEDFGN